jgi:hypothetical protein
MDKTISEEFTQIVEEICDNYCKYPEMPIPEGKCGDWLIEDEDSPCNKCPLMRL